MQQLLVGPFETLGSRKLCSENLRFLVLWCVSKHHRYALPLSNHSPLIHAFIFLGEERENSLAALYVFKPRTVRGATPRGELLGQAGRRSGWIPSITGYSFNSPEENHRGPASARHGFHCPLSARGVMEYGLESLVLGGVMPCGAEVNTKERNKGTQC